MKHCIWCSKKENVVTFNREAHTFPQSLEGKNVCVNICDSCNHYFGAPQPNLPAVEVALKEVLNISRYLVLYNKKVPKNKRFKSQYFDFNWDSYVLKLKPTYNLKQGFQERLGRQFKRGIYKIFLEERERIKQDAHSEKFNFIREFSRYNFGEFPVYYMKPKFPILPVADGAFENPSLSFNSFSDKEEKEFGIYSYQIMGHTFCIPTSKFFENFSLDRYRKYLIEIDNPFGIEILPIKYIADVDFTFKYLFRE